MQKLESSGAFSCSEMKPAFFENETSQLTYVNEGNSTLSNVRQLSRDSVRNDWRDAEADRAADYSRTSRWPCDDPIFIAPSWFSAPPGLTLPMGSLKTRASFARSKLRDVMTWPFQKLKITRESEKNMDPRSLSATTSMTFGAQVCAN